MGAVQGAKSSSSWNRIEGNQGFITNVTASVSFAWHKVNLTNIGISAGETVLIQIKNNAAAPRGMQVRNVGEAGFSPRPYGNITALNSIPVLVTTDQNNEIEVFCNDADPTRMIIYNLGIFKI